MSGYQSLELIGNVGRDPESFQFPSGDIQYSFSLAVSKKFKNDEGQQIETTIWFKCVTDRTTLYEGVLAPYVKKGHQLHINGFLKVPKPYMDNNGKPAVTLEVRIDRLTLLKNDPVEANETEDDGFNSDGNLRPPRTSAKNW